MIVSHFSYFIILLLGGGDVIETLGGHKTPVLKVVLCTCFTDPRFIAFIHFGPIYMFVRFAVHLYICYFGEVSNQIRITSTSESSCQARIYLSYFRSQAGLIITVPAYWTIERR